MVKNTIKLTLKEKVLKYLIENKESLHSIRNIANNLKSDYKNTFKVIDTLQPLLISKTKIGNINLIKINLVPKQEIYSIENKRTKELLQDNPKLKLMQKDIQNLNYPFIVVLIFGSTVKKTTFKYSDIDICIISDNKSKKEQLIKQLNLLSLNIEIHNFTTQDFISMLNTSQSNLGHEIVKNNIILYGIENYYNLISKWMKKE